MRSTCGKITDSIPYGWSHLACIRRDRKRFICDRRVSYTDLRGVVRRNGRVIDWHLLPAINVTALSERPDIRLRADNRFVVNAGRLLLRNTRQVFSFLLTRVIYVTDLSDLASSLGIAYAQQLMPAGNIRCTCVLDGVNKYK